ncbi:DUF799 domain-containing protein [Maricaulis sp.]|uniref:DUF799 domain-containing protein n=1 Tax=Maricaulis sp. TaxID=1486257 RepID=UPI003A9167C1
MKPGLPLIATLAIATFTVAGCATPTPPPSYDYSAFRAETPRSILVLPTLNNTLNVDAPDYFLSTLSAPFAERGYYVFPAHMVKSTLEESGLADPGPLYEADTTRLGELFGCDMALYVAINRWDSQYVVLVTQTTVEFEYQLRSCQTNETMWTHTEAMTYSPQASSSGNPLADLVAQAVVAAMEKAAPNYMPLARQANLYAVNRGGRGLPAGPYLPESYLADIEAFSSATDAPPAPKPDEAIALN